MSEPAHSARRPELPDRASYRQRWSRLHGGYDPTDSLTLTCWLNFVEAAARPLARHDVSADAVTVAGVAAAAAAVPAAIAGRRWHFASAGAVALSGVLDGMDGAVAALSGRGGGWGYVLDSMADRGADALYLLALRAAGASEGAVGAAASGVVALEYGRARAAAAGFDDIGVVSVGERPMRIIAAVVGLGIAGAAPRRARAAANTAASVTGLLAAAGASQFLSVAARALGRGQLSV